jgi:hypothetical protein
MTEVNLNVTTERAGTANREAAIRHIEKVMKLGYLTGEEAGRRVNYLKNARTKTEITYTLRDLPSMAKEPRDWDNIGNLVPVPVFLFTFALFTSMAALGGTIMGDYKPPPVGVYLATIPMLVFGIVGAITSLVCLVSKADQ